MISAKKIADRLYRQFSPAHKELVRIIYRSEIQAPMIGESAASLLKKYADELDRYGKKNEKKIARSLRTIAEKIEAGKQRWEIYKGILPEDIVELLRETSHEKSVPPQEIFKEYAPLKEMGESALRSTRRKLYFPLGLYFVSIYALKGTADVYLSIGTEGGKSFPPFLTFLLEHFLAVNFAIGLVFAALFILVPDKLPGFSKIFRAINGFLALGIIKVMNSLTFSPAEIIDVIEKEFAKGRTLRKDIDALVGLLRKSGILTTTEAVEVKLSAENGRMEEGIEIILKERKESIRDLNDMLQSAVGAISILMLAIPVSMVVMAMGHMLMNSSAGIAGAP